MPVSYLDFQTTRQQTYPLLHPTTPALPPPCPLPPPTGKQVGQTHVPQFFPPLLYQLQIFRLHINQHPFVFISSVVTTQPRPVPISPAYLTELSGVVSCPFCQQVVSSKVKYVPGRTAWGMCVILVMLFCGFCLIPFMVRSLHDVHHYCPQCKRLLHVHKR
uniref:LITAF domain-containing protein n=1 Tax=Takifugu rubripes TaxID=31033 RepID=A0A3B5KEQ8_TAKRU